MAGFECATMRFPWKARVDVVQATGHDLRALADYRLAAEHGLRTARDGLRWPLIEQTPGVYDWSSWLPMLRASQAAGVQVVWDLLHFGYPEALDPWSADFVERFAAFSAAAARVFASETGEVPWWAPVNEPSYYAFAAHHGHYDPVGFGRGDAWKRQLARCAIAAMHRLREVDARARFLHTDPVIHISAEDAANAERAEGHRQAMFASWDMLGGLAAPELGGSLSLLDIVGVNFYASNQWREEGRRVGMGEIGWRPFSQILQEVWSRYDRPIVIAETGAEDCNGPGWLRYVAGEARDARRMGVPVEGLCLYPVMDYAGWTDDRHCPCGLIGIEPGWGERRVNAAMAAELRREQMLMAWEAAGGLQEPATAAADG